MVKLLEQSLGELGDAITGSCLAFRQSYGQGKAFLLTEIEKRMIDSEYRFDRGETGISAVEILSSIVWKYYFPTVI